jgi:DNA-binding FrmR family transcriptional regulator
MYLPDEVKEEMQRNILSRLRKIEGQIRGLQGMVNDGKECEQILTQLRAAQSALKSVTGVVLKSFLTKCFSELGENPNPEEMYRRLEKTVVMLTKFIGA